MKKQDILQYISLLAAPTALWIVGIILLVHPDSAAALISRVLGWGLFLVGIGCGLSAIFRPGSTAIKIIGAIVFLCIGSWLIRNPLALAAMAGVVVGILLVIKGAQELFRGFGRGWSVVEMVLGVMLALLPLTTSRLVFSLCGLVMTVAGILMTVDRIRRARLDSGDNDPNIIDAL